MIEDEEPNEREAESESVCLSFLILSATRLGKYWGKLSGADDADDDVEIAS